jgi:hypothetical protein
VAEDYWRNPLGSVWNDLLGKYVLVGITRKDARDNVLELEQLHGRIISADPARGLSLQLEGSRAGTTYQLPPDLRSLKPAPRGDYRLRSTGEVIHDPDFLATWVIVQTDA